MKPRTFTVHICVSPLPSPTISTRNLPPWPTTIFRRAVLSPSTVTNSCKSWIEPIPPTVDGDINETILRERNVGVVIRNEHDLNVIHLREENTIRTSKGKENVSSYAKGKEKAKEDVTCQVILREKNVGVVIRNEHDLNVILLREENTIRTSKEKENVISYVKGKGKAKEDVTCQVILRERNVGVVIRNEHDLNVIRLREDLDELHK